MNALFGQEAKCQMRESAKSSNSRPQGQGVTIWLGKRTRVRFRVPPPPQNGQPLSVGLFVFRGAPRRAGLRPILPVPGEAPTEPLSHGFAPPLPSLLSESWPTGPFWHRHILTPVSRLYVCRRDRFAITSAPRSGKRTRDRELQRGSDGQKGRVRRTRLRGQQPLDLGQGAERRHGQCTDRRQRHPNGKAGPTRCHGPQRWDPPGAVLVRG